MRQAGLQGREEVLTDSLAMFISVWPRGCFWFYKMRATNGSLYIPGGSDGKASARNVGDPGSIPGLGRSPGEGNGKSWTQLSDWTELNHTYIKEKFFI